MARVRMMIKPHSSLHPSDVKRLRRQIETLQNRMFHHRSKYLDYDVRLTAVRQQLREGVYYD
jgi:hypothetical protein